MSHLTPPPGRPVALPVARRLAATMLLALGLGLVGPVGAQDQSLQDARTQREATLAEKARSAEQLDVLRAQEGEVRLALAGLDEALAFQDAKVATGTAALAAAEARAAGLRRLVEETAALVAGLRATSATGAVNAYIGAVEERTALVWFEATDVNDVVRRKQLLDVVESDLRDDLDQLRAVIEDQRRAEQEARVAAAAAARLAAELRADQAELQQRRDAQARLEEALRGSIADWQSKADELTRAEQQLDEVIRTRQAEEAAAAIAAGAPGGDGRGDGGGAGRTVALTAASASGFAFPADGGIASDFGYRRHPILGTVRLHAGIDIDAADGSDIWASKAGQVILAGWNGGYGNCVMIEHDGGIVTLYGHMSAIYVSEGETVARGAVIGAIGSTGFSTGPHLHFETRVDGEPQNPLLFVS